MVDETRLEWKGTLSPEQIMKIIYLFADKTVDHNIGKAGVSPQWREDQTA